MLTKHTKVVVFLAMTAVISLMMVACSSDDDSSSTPAAAPQAAAQTQGAPSAQQAPAAPSGVSATAVPAPAAAVAAAPAKAPAQQQSAAQVIASKETAAGKVTLAAPKVMAAVSGTTYNEAPQLAALVVAGSLPSVDKRLPDEPLVITPYNEVGKYGGTLNRAHNSATDFWNFGRLDRAGAKLVQWSMDSTAIEPAIASTWDLSSDLTTYTFSLRPGHKWSNGTAFTADDLEFYNNHTLNNATLCPNNTATMKSSTGNTPEFTKIDATTISWKFDSPYSTFLPALSATDTVGGSPCNEHIISGEYMSQFHEDTADADALAAMMAEEGFDTWKDLFNDRQNYRIKGHRGRPTLGPWYMSTPWSTDIVRGSRNPYFYQVDTAGNQLPYMDGLQYNFASDSSIITLKAVAGEIDMQGRHVRTQDIPTLMENRDRGNYDVFLWPYCGGTVASAYFNQTYKGPESVVTTNLKFREALSVATDREEINQTVYQGLGIAGQSVPPSTVGGYPGDDVRDYLTAYDLTDAVARLDALVASGELGAKDSDGFYTLPDGSPLKLILDGFDGFGSWTQVLEPLAQQWKEAGINAEPFPGPRPIIDDRTTSNEMMVRVEWMETACNTFEGRARTNIDNLWAPLWVRWVNGTDGAEEPPEWAKELKEMHERAPSLDADGRNALEKELYTKWTYKMLDIGIVTEAKQPFVVSRQLGNVPPVAFFNWAYRTPAQGRPAQWYFKD